MKIRFLICFLLFVIKSLGQTNSQVVFDTISQRICSCIQVLTKYNHLSGGDSCRNAAIEKYSKELAKLGIDIKTPEGMIKLDEEVGFNKMAKDCPGIYQLLQKEITPDYSLFIYFTGSYVSQKLSSSGLYEVTVKNDSLQEVKTFFSEIDVKKTLTRMAGAIEFVFVLENWVNPKTKKSMIMLYDISYPQTLKNKFRK